jgi:4-amino-4-deoxychorismate lyase
VSDAVLAVLGRGLVDPASPIVRADDAGLTRGDGCFEGCRLRAGVIDNLDAHLNRMARSAAALQLDFDPGQWRELAALAVGAWTGSGSGAASGRGSGEATVKLLITRGGADGEPVGFVGITPVAAETLRARREGVRVITLERGWSSDLFAGVPWLLGGVKTLSYAVNMAAQREALRRGADDVLFVSTDGVVLESPTSTAVWAVGRTLHTTPTGVTGILAGTTQQLLFERAAAAGWETAETLAGRDDLHAADALWLVSSVRGPVEVIELDGKTRPRVPDTDKEIRTLVDFPPA